MKIIINKSTKLVKYNLENDIQVIIGARATAVNNSDGSPLFIISDLRLENADVVEDVDNVPEDWAGNKYIYEGGAFTLSPDWVGPEL